MKRSAAVSCLLLLLGASPPLAELEVDVEGVRGTRGLLHVCATQKRSAFPDCRSDPSAHWQSFAATDHSLRLNALEPGRYAVTLFHDENANYRLDKVLGIPREGFGFSRNPKLRLGPPRYDSVDIELKRGLTRTRVRMQYLL